MDGKPYVDVDVAIAMDHLILAATELGLGTCWLGYPLSESDLIRELLAIPEEEHIRAVIALGYPDPVSPAATFRSERDEVEAFARWVGFG